MSSIARARRLGARGFTLVEMLVATAVAGIAIAAAFTFATYQIRGYSQQQDTQDMVASSRAMLDSVIEDVRSAGYGTAFYAGVAGGGAVGVMMDPFGLPLGVPAVWISDQVTGPVNGADGLGVMVGSDALTLLRVEGEPTFLPSSGVGATGMPPPPNTLTGPYTVMNQAALQGCATGNGSYLALVSDMVRQGEPASMLVQLADRTTWGGVAADGSGAVRFRSSAEYGIPLGPGGVAAQGTLPVGRVFGPGSLVVCVRLVTYWLDNIGRLRMFESRPGNIVGAPALTAGWPGGTTRPIWPATDPVIAENIRALQFEPYFSGQALLFTNAWALSTPPAAISRPADVRMMSETRAVRMSAIIATPRANDRTAGLNVPATLANSNIVAANFPNTHVYRVVTQSAELRNMRHFDLMSSTDRDMFNLRSYPP